MFKIIIVGGPAEPYIERCLESVLKQTEPFHAQVVLDPVGDKTFEKAKPYDFAHLRIHLNEKQMWALPNIIKSIELLKPSDEDILVTLDADDWFAGADTLSIIRSYYDKFPETLITHGSWKGHPDPNCNTNCVAYTKDEFDRGIRQVAWKGTHARTMKYKVWKHIKDEDLRNENGEYFRSAWDLAFMWPAMEMAGFERVKFISQKIYVYNRETPHNDEKLRSPEQQAFHKYLQTKKPYTLREVF
jgi:glycosyltransferase involved in cell wall biosynthesis